LTSSSGGKVIETVLAVRIFDIVKHGYTMSSKTSSRFFCR
jgi:hypothetical protein